MPLPTAEALVAAGLPADDASRLLDHAAALATHADAASTWSAVSRALLTPRLPHAVHRAFFAAAYAGTAGPHPAWVPGPEDLATCNLTPLLGVGGFHALHRGSVLHPERWWGDMVERLGVAWSVPPTAVLDRGEDGERGRWFPGARLNIAGCCFAHRDPSRVAVVARDEAGRDVTWSLGDLHARAVAWARLLQRHGVEPGHTVGLVLPMSPEAVAVYLGTVLIGAAPVGIADSFSAPEIAIRLRISEARLVVTQETLLRGGKVLPLAERVRAAGVAEVVLVDGPGLPPADPRAFTPHVADAEAVTNVLFSSGTTGTPKAIPWTHLTPLRAAADAWCHQDVRPGDVVAWPTNLGWMMGPWLVYAALLNDATLALYDGAPGTAAFCRFVVDARVTMLGVVPALVRTWRAGDHTAGCDWSSVRCFSSTGEASSPDDMLWLMARAGWRPVIEYCGGTELGGGYVSGSRVQAQVASAFSTPTFGCDFVLLDEQGGLVHGVGQGEVAILAPVLGSSNRLLNGDHHEVYFAGMPRHPDGRVLRRHGDQVGRLPGGFYRALGRVDDTMNLGGVKVSSAELERSVASVEGVVETAAVAWDPPEGGPSQLVFFAVLQPDATPDGLLERLRAAVRAQLSPLFHVARLEVVASLPRTASGKVVRRLLRSRLAPPAPAP